jgi:hypothetical protein
MTRLIPEAITPKNRLLMAHPQTGRVSDPSNRPNTGH